MASRPSPRKSARKKTASRTKRPAAKARKAPRPASKAPRPRRAKAAPSKAAKRQAPARTKKIAKARVTASAKPRPAPIVKMVERKAPVAEARPLRVVLFGASGNVGLCIAKEALARGHHVTAVMRNPDRLQLANPNLRALRADATDPLLVATVAKGHDVIISAIAPARDAPESLAQAAQAILQGAREADIKRVVIVNGAGSLLVGNKMLMDTPQFPADWRWLAKAHYDALKVLRSQGAGLDWTAVSPAAMVEPGKRTGKFRTGGDDLLADAKGNSHISTEDYAAALMDELEGERYVGKRMTVAY